MKKNRDNKGLAYNLERDDTSSFIPYCAYEQHPLILNSSVYKKCKRLRCYHLHIFRPEGINQKIVEQETINAETRTYKSFSEMELTVRFL